MAMAAVLLPAVALLPCSSAGLRCWGVSLSPRRHTEVLQGRSRRCTSSNAALPRHPYGGQWVENDEFQFKLLEKVMTYLDLGTQPPNFELGDPSTGKTWELKDFEHHKALLVMFTSYDCPFVRYLRAAITRLIHEFMPKGLGAVAISSNSGITHPQDGPPQMVEEAEKFQYQFPYLRDETQDVAKAYGPLGTPDFFLFAKNDDGVFELAYHGQFDDARPHDESIPITGKDLRAAIECVLSGKAVSPEQRPSMGCSIKWHPVAKKVPDEVPEKGRWGMYRTGL